MRKTAVVLAAVIGCWLAAGMTGCQGDLSSQLSSGKPEDYAGSVVNDIKAQAVEEIKKAFASEVEEFFTNDDLAASLGISSDEQGKLEESIKAYISQYGQNEEKLGEAKESLEKLLENTEGLSAEELQSRLSNIFEKENK